VTKASIRNVAISTIVHCHSAYDGRELVSTYCDTDKCKRVEMTTVSHKYEPVRHVRLSGYEVRQKQTNCCSRN